MPGKLGPFAASSGTVQVPASPADTGSMTVPPPTYPGHPPAGQPPAGAPHFVPQPAGTSSWFSQAPASAIGGAVAVLVVFVALVAFLIGRGTAGDDGTDRSEFARPAPAPSAVVPLPQSGNSAAPSVAAPQDGLVADSAAKSDSRNLVSQVESCAVDSVGGHAGCDTPAELGDVGIALGAGPGQAEIVDATQDTYTIVGHSESGVDFTITKTTPAGDYERTCAPAGRGACAAGAW